MAPKIIPVATLAGMLVMLAPLAQAAQAQADSDDQDRKIYMESLANADEFQTAIKDCRALQIKYRLQGNAVICAKWELARQVEEAVTEPDEPAQ